MIMRGKIGQENFTLKSKPKPMNIKFWGIINPSEHLKLFVFLPGKTHRHKKLYIEFQ